MTLEINRKPSKTGLRNVYFPTINGKRLNSTNFRRKWEAVKFGRKCVQLLTNNN